MKIVSLVRPSAYYPEIYAYKDYFEKINGFDFEIIHGDSINDLYAFNADCYLSKIGFDPFYQRRSLSDKIIIHDYTSCSVGKFAIFKDFAKSKLNRRANINIFLNTKVMKNFGFTLSDFNIIRDMGVDDFFFTSFSEKKEHDLIYAGALNSIRSVDIMLQGLEKSGRSITLIGEPSLELYEKWKSKRFVNFLGRLNRRETAIELGKANYGLNLTPNVYPFYFQTSTKMIEYCAVGLKIICNKNLWNLDFEQSRNAKFFFTDDFILPHNLDDFEFKVPFVDDLRWFNVISNSGLLDKLRYFL